MPEQSPAGIQLDVAAIERVGGPVAAKLVPGWKITWTPIAPEEIDKLNPPGPNLAVVSRPADGGTVPERRIAKVYVRSPWPSGESLKATLMHELAHVWVAPLIACLPDANSPAALMLEEQLVEDMGNFLASLPAPARRAVLGQALALAPERMRARISARATMRARGGQMDPELVKQALDALEAGDGEKCKELLKGLVAAAASGGAAPAMEPDGDEGAPGAMPAEAAAGPAPEKSDDPMMQGARPAARKENAQVSDIATMRARKEAQDLAADMKRMHGAALPNAKQALIVGARARLGADAISPATEKRILAAPTFERAEEILAIIEETPVAVRARSGVEHQSGGPVIDGPKVAEETELLKEGFDLGWVKSYQAIAKRDPVAGAAELEGGREALSARRARRAQNGGAS